MLEGADSCYIAHVASAGTPFSFFTLFRSQSPVPLGRSPSFLYLIVAFLSGFASEARLNAVFWNITKTCRGGQLYGGEVCAGRRGLGILRLWRGGRGVLCLSSGQPLFASNVQCMRPLLSNSCSFYMQTQHVHTSSCHRFTWVVTLLTIILHTHTDSPKWKSKVVYL